MSGIVEEVVIEKMEEYAETVSLRGLISNILMAIDLYNSKRAKEGGETVKIINEYIEDSLAELSEGHDAEFLEFIIRKYRNQNPETQKIVSDFDRSDYESMVPEIISILNDIVRGSRLDEQALIDARKFLELLEKNLTVVGLLQAGGEFDGGSFLTWHQ